MSGAKSMGENDHTAVESNLRLLFQAGTVAGVSDRHLLEMFAFRRDELAFTALVERHGPMVQRVCRAALGDHHEAQDSFQATPRLWDIASGQELHQQPGPWYDAMLVYGPEGKTVAVASPTGTIQVLDTATWQVQRAYPSPGKRATAFAIGPDERLFSGTPDGTVPAWDPLPAKPPANPQ
jgi:hypothetical protein